MHFSVVHKFPTIDCTHHPTPLPTCFINLLPMNQTFIKLSFESFCQEKKVDVEMIAVVESKLQKKSKETSYAYIFRATKADRYAENYKLSCFRYKSERGDKKPKKAW